MPAMQSTKDAERLARRITSMCDASGLDDSDIGAALMSALVTLFGRIEQSPTPDGFWQFFYNIKRHSEQQRNN